MSSPLARSLFALPPLTPKPNGGGYIFVVNPSVPANSVKELIALAAKPGSKLSYGSAGIGNTLPTRGRSARLSCRTCRR